MKTEVYLYEDGRWDKELDKTLDSKSTLIIVYGSTNFSQIKDGFDQLKNNFPNSTIVGNSTSGEIYNDELYEHTLTLAIIKFEKTKIKTISTTVENPEQSYQSGISIAKQLEDEKLKSIFILSDGLNVNGSQLTKGINSVFKNNILVTGGLAGDDANFSNTWTLLNDEPKSKQVVAVGFYGDDINVAYGSQGGWTKFGIDRVVTKSNSNVVYEIDGKPALEVYKTYLGDSVKDLPLSGLYYPLMIQEDSNSDEEKVRTILSVNEDDQSITFAGDIPSGSKAMFMKASFEQLVDGASNAVGKMVLSKYKDQDALNIAISCVGRKLVLGQKTEDEIEAVYQQFGDNVKQIGFYSYGEISPLESGSCDLHNQTMTLTMMWES